MIALFRMNGIKYMVTGTENDFAIEKETEETFRAQKTDVHQWVTVNNPSAKLRNAAITALNERRPRR